MSQTNNEIVLDIVTRVAELEAREPSDLNPPLANAINTDALVNLLDQGNTPIRITFEYLDHEVTVLRDFDGLDVFVRSRE